MGFFDWLKKGWNTLRRLGKGASATLRKTAKTITPYMNTVEKIAKDVNDVTGGAAKRMVDKYIPGATNYYQKARKGVDYMANSTDTQLVNDAKDYMRKKLQS